MTAPISRKEAREIALKTLENAEKERLEHAEREAMVGKLPANLVTEYLNLTECTKLLTKLREFVDESLPDASQVDDAVNWGDLSCVEAAIHLNEEGEIRFSVLIEEADPSAQKLKAYIYEKLAKHPEWKDREVIVNTEW